MLLVWIALLPLLLAMAVCLLAVEQRAAGLSRSARQAAAVPPDSGSVSLAGLFRDILLCRGRPRPPLLQTFGAIVALAASLLMCGMILLAVVADGYGPLPVGLPLLIALYATGVFGGLPDSRGQMDCETAWNASWNVLALAASVLGVILLCGTTDVGEIARQQQRDAMWLLARQPLGFAAFWLAASGHAAAMSPLPRGAQAADQRRWPEAAVPGVVAAGRRLQMVALAYVAVLVFLGGGHFWGLTSGLSWGLADSAGSVAEWLGGVLLLHVKLLGALAWLVWLYCIRLPGREGARLLERAWVVAFPTALLNVVVTAASEEFLGAEAALLKAAAGWGTLVVVLCVAAACARVLEPNETRCE